MSDELTLSDLPAPAIPMPTPIHRNPRRNAKPKPKAKPRHAPRFRNAAPPPRAAQLKKEILPEPTVMDRLRRIGTTVVGAGVASVTGAAAVKYGFHPDFVSIVLGGVGLLSSATLKRELYRDVGLGAASAAGSQLVLMHIHPAAAKPDPEPSPSKPTATPTSQPVRRANADLGALPPGMLDAAFEQARAELAVSSDGYPPGYEPPQHHYRHGPVYPSG